MAARDSGREKRGSVSGVSIFAINRLSYFLCSDPPKGFGAHSDQERILESELHRFVRFQYDVVTALARSR